MDPQLLQQLTQTVYISQAIGRDEFGQIVYSQPAPKAARVRDLQRLIQDKTGAQTVSVAELLVAEPVNLEDRVWPPGADPNDVNQARMPLNRLNLYDEHGNFEACKVWL